MKYINICVEEIKILDKALDSDTEEGVDSVLLPGLRQLVDLNVPHGHLWLYQLLGRLQVR